MCNISISFGFDDSQGVKYSTNGSNAQVEISSDATGNIVIPANISYGGQNYIINRIVEKAFANTSITSIELPSSLDDNGLGDYVFEDCKSLKTVIINGTSKLKNNIFKGCTSLQTVLITGEIPEALNGIFSEDYIIYLSKKPTTGSNWDTQMTQNNVVVAGSVDDSNRTDASSGTGAIIYKRTFGTTQWQPWYENFDMAYNDWKNDFDMAELVNIHTYHDGSWLLELDLLGEGSSVKANIPYMVRAKSKGDKSLFLTNSTKVAFTSNTITCKSTENTYKFIGNIEAKTKFIVDGLYAVSAGALKKVVGNGVNLKAGRWYLILENRLSQVTDNPSEVRIRLKEEADADIEADEITGIFSANNNNVKTESYYTTSGVRINKPHSGINIIRMSDGTTRKVIIK